MHHRRPRGEHEKTFQERLAEEISHLNDDANGTARNLPSPQISLSEKTLLAVASLGAALLIGLLVHVLTGAN